MKRLIQLVLTLVAAFASASAFRPAPIPEDASEEAYFNRIGDADAAIKRGDWHEAENALQEALLLDPHSPVNVMVLSNLGIVQLNMGRDSLAVATLTKAHSKAPRSVTVLQNRARAYTALGDLDSAYDDYSMAVSLDSMASPARFNRAIISLKRGRVARAAADVEFLERTAPDLPETSIARGALANATGDFETAVRAYTRVIADDPQPEYYAERALAYLMTDSLNEASSDIAEGLRRDPSYPSLYLYRAMYHKACYRPDEARADLEKAVSLGADRAKARAIIETLAR